MLCQIIAPQKQVAHLASLSFAIVFATSAFPSVSLRKIRLAKKRRKEVPRKEENQAGIRTLRVRYALFGHCLRSKHLQALGLYAHIAHNCNEVA